MATLQSRSPFMLRPSLAVDLLPAHVKTSRSRRNQRCLTCRAAVTTRPGSSTSATGGSASQPVRKLERKGAKEESPTFDPMELLELERGVCNPFKKYSPELVSLAN